ncbi:hypothetical protein [Haloferax sp. ATB1]|nr:hypothetical protein [Haloferax sp. ATB1]
MYIGVVGWSAVATNRHEPTSAAVAYSRTLGVAGGDASARK